MHRIFTADETFQDPSCPISVDEDPMHSGRVPRHAHEFSEIVCVVEGSGIYRFEDEALPAQRGDVFVISPGEIHDLTANGQMKLQNFMCDRIQCLDQSFVGSPAYAALFDLIPRLRQRPNTQRHLRVSDQELATIQARHSLMKWEEHDQAIAWQQRMSAGLQDVVAILCRSWGRQYGTDNHGALNLLAPVISHIHAHLDEGLEVADLAHLVNCSPGHLRRLFREALGESPKAYIMAKRIALAEKLLRHSDESITRIGLRCGFCDGTHFAKVFRAMRGISPKQFRQ